MKKTQIRVFVHDQRGDVLLRTFLAALEAVLEVGSEVDRCRNNGKSRIQWKIADLQHGSAAAVIEGVPRSSRFRPEAEEVVAAIVDGIAKLEERCRQVPRFFTERSFKKLRGLSQRSGPHTTISIGEQAVTQQTAATIDGLTTSNVSATDTIDGHLDLARVRGGKRFLLFDDQDRKIECFFPDELQEEVRKGWGRKVRVRGEVQYSALGVPLTISVKQLTLVEPDSEIDLDSFVGIWNLGMPAEEYVRQVRDE